MADTAGRGSWDARVREALESARTAPELTRALFGPGGLFAEAGRTREDREQLLLHPLYQEAQARLSELRRAEVARFESDLEELEARPARLTVQLPRSLHTALKCEAAREGVSLSELIRLKLGLPYAFLTRTMISEPLPRGR